MDPIFRWESWWGGYYETVLCRTRGTCEGTTQDPGLWGIGGLGLVELLRWFGSFVAPEDLRLLLMDPGLDRWPFPSWFEEPPLEFLLCPAGCRVGEVPRPSGSLSMLWLAGFPIEVEFLRLAACCIIKGAVGGNNGILSIG